jgi:hypothetical protein
LLAESVSPLLAESLATYKSVATRSGEWRWLANYREFSGDSEWRVAVAGELSSGEWWWLANYREFSGDSEWRVVVTGELLFIFGFIRASILCDDGLD